MNSLYIIGFPSLYGGAGAELYHQIKVWGHLGVEMHLIPTQKNAHRAELYLEMVGRASRYMKDTTGRPFRKGRPSSVFAMRSFWRPSRRYENGRQGQSSSIA